MTPTMFALLGFIAWTLLLLVLMEAIGGGLTWGAALARW